ncbi:MAG: chorismate synthase [Bacteroidales bacterium]|nr:chorismate synthase [Bacteroidales bacterium]
MNSFGNIFRITLYGESHGKEIGIVVDGCPTGIPLAENDMLTDIERRKAGGYATSARTENDIPEIRSGIYRGHTTGAPIMIAFRNENFRDEDYQFDGFFRPGHADYAAYRKYNGYNNPLGGGQFSGRMTLPIVAAGCIAKKIIHNVEISASILPECLKNVERAMPDDSAGGIIECRIRNLDAGIGEPFFNSLESLISHAIFSIPGAKAIEFGNGIASASMLGSEYNDCIVSSDGKTATNNCGGINGGISNGNEIIFRTYFHPTPSIAQKQHTFNFETKQMQDFEIQGRHDVCYALRTPVIVEALTAIVITDLTLTSGQWK